MNLRVDSSSSLVSQTAVVRNRSLQRERPDDDSVKRAIEYLLACTNGSVADCLRSIGVKPKSTQAQQRKQVEAALDTPQLSRELLGQWLDQIEGWGNHQVHFFTGTPDIGRHWKNGKAAVAKLDELDVWYLVDAQRPLWPTRQPEIYRISHQGTTLRISWAEERVYEVRVEEKDIIEPDIVYKAFQKQHRRCFHHFEYNAVLKQGTLIMAKLPSGGSYPDLCRQLLEDARPYVAREGLQIVDLRPAIRNLENDSTTNTLRRRLSLQTTDQTKIEVVSAQKERDAFAHPVMQTIQGQLLGGTSATKGMFYWLIGDPPLQRYIGTRVLPRENRFSIEGQCTEAEVMHVLQNMRTIS